MSLVFYRTLVPLGPLPCIASPKITSLQFTNTLWIHGYGYISYMIDHEYLNLGNVKNGQKMRSSSSSHRINMGFSSFSKIQLKDKWHTHNKRLISQRSPAYPRLYHIPNKNIDPELSFKRNFSFSNFFRFFRLSPELEYANEIIAKLGILSHTLEMCEKSSAFELFHSFWSFINILWGLVHKECNFDEKTRCGKNRPFFIDFFKKPYNLTLRSRQGVKIRLNTINMLEKVQLKAPPRLPKSFGQIRETFFFWPMSYNGQILSQCASPRMECIPSRTKTQVVGYYFNRKLN